MDKRFKNNYLANNVKQLIEGKLQIEPIKGDIGGFSIEFTNGSDIESFESILYKDEDSRDADLKLLTELL